MLSFEYVEKRFWRRSLEKGVTEEDCLHIERKRPRPPKNLKYYDKDGIEVIGEVEVEEEVLYEEDGGESDNRLNGSYWQQTTPGKRVRKNSHLRDYKL